LSIEAGIDGVSPADLRDDRQRGVTEIVMPVFSRNLPVRVPHHEPGFFRPDFVAAYSVETDNSFAGFQPILDYVAQQLDPMRPADILEIGPGPGWMASRLAMLHPQVRVTGIEISAAFVALANHNSRREGVDDRATFTLGDAAELNGLADGSFDIVLSNQSLHYWEPPERVFNQIARVLKPSGVFCIGDDRRDLNWRGKLEVLLGRCLHSRLIGSSWVRSLSGCLTPTEAADALERSDLRDRWRIAIHPRTMLITSNSRA
jgi:SAM-dependent methyltransferase